MVDYKRLYHIMVDASERAIAAISQQNYGAAKKTLIRAEREAEEWYLAQTDEETAEREAPQGRSVSLPPCGRRQPQSG